MAKVTAPEYAKEILRICSESKIIKNWNVKIHEAIIASIRVFLVDNSFIEIYYNLDTGKISFAWIRNKERIYGADNLGYWHSHPMENPKEHVKSSEITFTQFLHNIEKYFKRTAGISGK